MLAAIGTVESDNGQSTLPGVQSGANSAGAEGPMQFLPATFAAYALPVPPGGQTPASPYDPTDAIYAAARDLCTNGAGQPATLPAAIYDYNHSTSYVDEVLTLAQLLSGEDSPDATAAEIAVSYALAQIGTPYQWGGEEPGGFDCSGLTQAAYAAAGIQLPRTAQQQYDTGPPVPAGQPLQPGDLVFFGPDTSNITHVGIVVNQTEMVDAPHAGADRPHRVLRLARLPRRDATVGIGRLRLYRSSSVSVPRCSRQSSAGFAPTRSRTCSWARTSGRSWPSSS